ncbi:MAG: GTPase ObgE [Deltaproteobacteria bacterium]|nr:GTPase ObgE [Deltaproteobacteria bacterium]
MKFVDEARITVKSGSGGNGSRSFLREKFRPKGGPDGGHGGRGGDVVLLADPQLGTLLDFRYQPRLVAENGQDGQGRQKTGRAGEPLRIRLPVGTVVTDADSGELIVDLAEPNEEFVVARGGRGGRGNIAFATSTNQAPEYAESGGPSESREIQLTLKLIADVGLVGFPNAGKSTLISRLSAAKPKIADYPFTTLTPNLGIVRTSESKNFVLADIPGLIEGASEGRGLGHQFLKHIERVAALAILLDVSADPKRHPVTDFETLMKELVAYSPAMLDKPRVIVLTKADLPDTEAALDEVRSIAEAQGAAFFLVSSVRGDGLDDLAYALQALVDRARAARWARRAGAITESDSEV